MFTFAVPRRHRMAPLTVLLMGVIALLLLFTVAFDQGQLAQIALAGSGNTMVHEAFHDARHILAFPCH